MDLLLPSPLQQLNLPIFEKYGVSVYVKRDDLIHSEISGNKWRKLKFNFEKFRQGKYDAVLTFGGAYSNHIAATAFLGKQLNIPTIGIIRGEELTEESNATLSEAHKNLMQLKFVSRAKYSERYEKLYWQELRSEYGNILIIEEGGANFLGLQGCAQILSEIPFEPTYVITAAGTGTTAAGLLYNARQTQVIAVPVFKNGGFILDEIKNLLAYSGLDDEDILEKLDQLSLETRYHFGGYGKHTPQLLDFMNHFYQVSNVPLDQVYTAKMMYAFYEKLKEGYFTEGASIILLHTGGIQGTISIKEKLNY